MFFDRSRAGVGVQRLGAGRTPRAVASNDGIVDRVGAAAESYSCPLVVVREAADSPCCPRYLGYQDWCRHRRTEGPDLTLITAVALVGSGVIVAIPGSARKKA
jgi:hypothetical protein